MFQVIPLRSLKHNANIQTHDIFPFDRIRIDCVERVIHHDYTISPESCQGILRPWSMHRGQSDHLMVLQGERLVELYCPSKKQSVCFRLTPNKIFKGETLLYEGAYILSWPPEIFHRIVTKKGGSISVNFTTYTTDINFENNFGVYDVNTTTGSFMLIRSSVSNNPGKFVEKCDAPISE